MPLNRLQGENMMASSSKKPPKPKAKPKPDPSEKPPMIRPIRKGQ